LRPIAYVPGLARIFITYQRDSEGYEGSDADSDEVSDENVSGAWLDPVTGRITAAGGELRPLMHQTYRPLQRASVADEFWAALPNSDKSETLLGTYNMRTQKFTLRLKLPQIEFDSMRVWVDEAEGKAYIVYEGQLLSVPLTSPNQRP
jgi:hypothetical protein